MVQDSKVTTLGGVAGCKIEVQCKGEVRADSVSSLIVAGKRGAARSGVGFENMVHFWVMK